MENSTRREADELGEQRADGGGTVRPTGRKKQKKEERKKEKRNTIAGDESRRGRVRE